MICFKYQAMGEGDDRNSRARQAGEILYNFGRGDSTATTSVTR